MSLDAAQINQIRSAVPTIVANADAVATAFYAQLFALEPTLRLMFRGDMTEQGRKLMSMLSVALNNLDKLDTLRPALKALGERHIDYGVTAGHYDIVGRALIGTLELMLGEAFTLEARQAWVALYGALTVAITGDLYSATESAAD